MTRRAFAAITPPACFFPLIVALLSLLGGCGLPSFLVTPISHSNKIEEQEVQPAKGWGGGKIAIIEVEGMLMNARGGGSILGISLLGSSENPMSKFAQQMEAAERDPAVKAVVLRINSPGGTVTSSDTMYEIVKRFREKTKKPVVASTQEVCASGGYYLACAADKIVVQPTSVVGSIGVIFESIQFKGTMDKLGITMTAIKSGYLKDMGSPWKLLKDDEAAVMQTMVDEYFHRFVELVRSRRNISEAAVADLNDYKKATYSGVFSGRVFSGAKAVELGLADQTGILPDAIDEARKLAKAPNASAVMYIRPYGYGGSIYASTSVPQPQANTLQINLPESATPLPTGFYYLWRP
jgi:protease-4